MATALELRQVQKGKAGRIHLAVPGKAEASVRTLCNKLFQAGEYREVEDEPDCQLCRRRRGNKALVSSAFFEGDMGTQLLEMSLQEAKAGRSRRQAERSASDAAARLAQPPEEGEDQRRHPDGGRRRQPTGTEDRRPAPGAGGRRGTAARGKPSLSLVPEPEKPERLGNLALAGLQQVSDHVYRSPAGVVIRGRKRGKTWEVAEVVFDGPIQVKHDTGGRAQLKIGDVTVEVSAQAGEVRAAYRVEGSH